MASTLELSGRIKNYLGKLEKWSEKKEEVIQQEQSEDSMVRPKQSLAQV